MVNLISINNIKINQNADDWEEAVRIAGNILESEGYVTDKYVEAMVTSVKELGPYIVVTKGVAMPHAKGVDGVLKSGISVVTLNKGVEFGNKLNDPVRLIVGLAGASDEKHLSVLKLIASVLENEENVEKIISCNSEEVIFELFENFEMRM